jgi:hypothetical protein
MLSFTNPSWPQLATLLRVISPRRDTPQISVAEMILFRSKVRVEIAVTIIVSNLAEKTRQQHEIP